MANLDFILSLEDVIPLFKRPAKMSVALGQQMQDVLVAVHDTTMLFLFDGNDFMSVWVCSGDDISSISWFDVTDKLSVLVVGFESGVVKIFDKMGNVMISQHIDTSSVESIKVNVTLGKRFHSDLVIVYEKILVYVSGMDIFDSLTSSSKQWKFQKYRLSGSSRTDITPIDGLIYPLVDPNDLCFIGVGQNPILVSYPILQSSNSFSTIQLASKVASKLTSAVFSFATRFTPWSSTSKEQSPDEVAQNVQPVLVSASYSLLDPTRIIQTISHSPTRQFLVTSDNFGRVILFDATSLTAIKWWKGYRDAMVGWICHPTSSIPLLFLVIYLPRRELLEIWRIPLGLRVASIPNIKISQLRWCVDAGHGTCISNTFLINQDGRVMQLNLSQEILQSERRYLFFPKEIYTPSLGESLFNEIKLEIVNWSHNHVCDSCISFIDDNSFELDPSIDSSILFQLLSQLALVPVTEAFTIDFILTEFFPVLNSLEFYSCNNSQNSSMEHMCVGYISDVLQLALRAINDSIKSNYLITDRLLENQFDRLEISQNRILLFSRLCQLYIWSHKLKSGLYVETSKNDGVELSPKANTHSSPSFTPVKSRRQVNRVNRISISALEASEIDQAFNLDYFDAPIAAPEKSICTTLFSTTSVFTISNYSFMQFFHSLQIDVGNLKISIDPALSTLAKQQVACILFSPVLKSLEPVTSVFADSSSQEETSAPSHVKIGSTSSSVANHSLSRLSVLLSTFIVDQLRELFLPWLSCSKSDVFSVLDLGQLNESDNSVTYSILYLLTEILKFANTDVLKQEDFAFFALAFECCQVASGSKIHHACFLAYCCEVLLPQSRLETKSQDWPRLKYQLEMTRYIYQALCSNINSSSLNFSVKSLLSDQSLWSLASNYLLELGLPLPAVFHVVEQSFPQFTTSPFKCPSFASMLETVSEKQAEVMKEKVSSAIKVLKLVCSKFSDFYCSDHQIIVSIVLSLVTRWLKQKKAVTFIPISFSSKNNSCTVYLPNEPAVIINDAKPSNLIKSEASENKSSDSLLEQAIVIIEAMPLCVSSAMLSFYLWSSVFSPILFSFSSYDGSKSIHNFLSTLKLAPSRAQILMRMSQRLLFNLLSFYSSPGASQSSLLFGDNDVKPILIENYPNVICFKPKNSSVFPYSLDLSTYSLLQLFSNFYSKKDFCSVIERHLVITQVFSLLIECNIDSLTNGDVNFISTIYPGYVPELASFDAINSVRSKLPFVIISSLSKLPVYTTNIDSNKFRLLVAIVRHCVKIDHRIESIPSILVLSKHLLGVDGPDKVKLEFARVSFEFGRDGNAEEYINQVQDKHAVAILLLSVCEQRLAIAIQYIIQLHGTAPEKSYDSQLYPSLIATVSSQVLNALKIYPVALDARKSLNIRDISTLHNQVRNVQNMLARILNNLPRDSVEKQQASAYSDAAKQLSAILKLK